MILKFYKTSQNFIGILQEDNDYLCYDDNNLYFHLLTIYYNIEKILPYNNR